MEIEKSKKDFVPSNVFGEDILISDNTNFEFEVKKFLFLKDFIIIYVV